MPEHPDTIRLSSRAEAEIVHPLTDEPRGVRRFFLRDPDGHVINVLSHPYGTRIGGPR